MTIDFKPSDVDLSGSFPPLAATMGRVEREAAATLIVRACQVKGDAWGPVLPREVGEAWRTDREAGREPLASLASNPFWRPDVGECVAHGFARWLGDDGEDRSAPVELTEKGLQAISRWVRRDAPGKAP